MRSMFVVVLVEIKMVLVNFKNVSTLIRKVGFLYV